VHLELGHFLAPTARMWAEAGLLLRRARGAFGQMEFVYHFRDLLIAIQAAQAKATLVTENTQHFARWRTLLARTRGALKLFDPTEAAP
jgi:predicted nucleic acid-binding protein